MRSRVFSTLALPASLIKVLRLAGTNLLYKHSKLSTPGEVRGYNIIFSFSLRPAYLQTNVEPISPSKAFYCITSRAFFFTLHLFHKMQSFFCGALEATLTENLVFRMRPLPRRALDGPLMRCFISNSHCFGEAENVPMYATGCTASTVDALIRGALYMPSKALRQALVALKSRVGSGQT